MKLSHQVSKAFLLCKHNIELEGFKSLRLGETRHLAISEDYAYSISENGESTAILLGYAHGIRDSRLKEEDLLETLLLSKGHELYDHLDFLNGRYIILLNRPEELYIYSDATSFKPVFYNRENEYVSSHEYIIRTLMEEKGYSLEHSKIFRKGYMDLTTTEKIYKLSPSIELGFDGFEFNRIFPRKPRKEMEIKDILKEMDKYLKESLEWLSQHGNMRFSLTGGLDSRVSLAVMKPLIGQMSFFTYTRPDAELKTPTLEKSYKDDEFIVKSMVYNLGLDHEFFSIGYEQGNKSYYDWLDSTVSSRHSYQLSRYLNENSKYNGAMHIKSTIQSIGKSSFDTELYDENSFENAVLGMNKWVPAPYKGKGNREELKSLLSGYLERVKLKETFEYHMLDLMFLESRLGNFQSNITQETDNTLEVYNLFNSRRMIELFLAPRLEERQNQTLAYSIIDEYWPILRFFGINTRENLYQAYAKLEKETEKVRVTDENEVVSPQNLELKTSTSLSVENDKEGTYLIPNTLPLKPGGEYRIDVINPHDYPVEVEFRSGYSKEQGRGRIKVLIEGDALDIVDLFDGHKMRVEPRSTLEMHYDFLSEINKSSWQRAAKLYAKWENGAE